MKGFFYVMTALAVLGLAFWAYRENYNTQQVLRDNRDIQREIGDARERLTMLRAEWAYLNRPDRLRELAEINFPRLGLLPFRADQFGRVDQVAFPRRDPLPITAPIDVSTMSGEEWP